MLNYKDIFNPGTLNIFTDASIKKLPDGETLGCPGALCVYTLNNGQLSILDVACYIERYATNNSSEIKAISLGVAKALQYRNLFRTINLFSDSRICIQGIREWIFNWVNCINSGLMCSSSGEPVANQNTFASISSTIVSNNLNINFYHQKGHVKKSNDKAIENAMRVFKEVNKLDVSFELMKELSNFNDLIDVTTGVELEMLNLPLINPFTKQDVIMRFDMDNFDSYKYQELINSKTKINKGHYGYY